MAPGVPQNMTNRPREIPFDIDYPWKINDEPLGNSKRDSNIADNYLNVSATGTNPLDMGIFSYNTVNASWNSPSSDMLDSAKLFDEYLVNDTNTPSSNHPQTESSDSSRTSPDCTDKSPEYPSVAVQNAMSPRELSRQELQSSNHQMQHQRRQVANIRKNATSTASAISGHMYPAEVDFFQKFNNSSHSPHQFLTAQSYDFPPANAPITAQQNRSRVLKRNAPSRASEPTRPRGFSASSFRSSSQFSPFSSGELPRSQNGVGRRANVDLKVAADGTSEGWGSYYDSREIPVAAARRIYELEQQTQQANIANSQMRQRLDILEAELEFLKTAKASEAVSTEVRGRQKLEQRCQTGGATAAVSNQLENNFPMRFEDPSPSLDQQGEFVLRHKNGIPITKKEFKELMSQVCGTSTNPFPQTLHNIRESKDAARNNDNEGLMSHFEPSLDGLDWSTLFNAIQPRPDGAGNVLDDNNNANKDEEDLFEGDVMPREPKYIDCEQIWECLQARKTESFDMDEFCEMLRQKAKCSVDGPVFLEKEVCQAFGNAKKAVN